MFTDDSIYLRYKILPKVNIKNTNELKLLYKYLQNIKIDPLQQTYSKNSKKSSKISTHFVDENIINETKKLENITKIKLHNNKIKVTLNIYANENIDKFVENIIPIIEYVCNLATTSINNLTINYFLLDMKKLIGDNEYLSTNEINSGYCSYKDKHTSDITIWRKEEIIKVTIHELFHALHYDFSTPDNQNIINHYQKKYNISSPKINTNEAYTEIWANLINCFIISEKIKRNKYNAFLTLVYLEKEFCLYQTNKIIKHYNITKKVYDINKFTNVLAYFFIRCEVFEKLTQFLKSCRLNNIRYVKFKNKNKWYEFLKNNKKITINNIPNKSNDYYYLTSRMSLNEIKTFMP